MKKVTVNKKELSRRLARHAGLSEVDANAVIGFVVDEIKAAVINGEQVTLAGFGVFEARHRAPRMGRNPYANEPNPIPARALPVFRAGEAFREIVQAAAEQRNNA